jgi:hypothetical protein
LTPPVFPCTVNAATPVPARLPRVVWRAGLDLEPVDLSDPGEVGWLEALVWPEQTDRLARLRAAIKIASEQKPRLVKGDLRTDLAELAREAPKDVTLVIFGGVVLRLPSGRTGGVCAIGRLALRFLDRERNTADPSGHRRARRPGGTEGQLPAVRERRSDGLGRSAWRIGRLDRSPSWSNHVSRCSVLNDCCKSGPFRRAPTTYPLKGGAVVS